MTVELIFSSVLTKCQILNINEELILQPEAQKSTDSPKAKSNHENDSSTVVCTALYDYEAQGDDELTLHRGDIIEVLSQDVNISGDEGWWTGKISGKVSICIL